MSVALGTICNNGCLSCLTCLPNAATRAKWSPNSRAGTRLMSLEDFELTLVRSPDDNPPFGAEYEAELRKFAKEAQVSR
jgi:hypothetical protein